MLIPLHRWLSIAMTGLAGLGLAQGPRLQGFSFSSVSNRLITPNGDGKNDKAVFSFANPRFSSVTGKVYDTHGKFVADMAADPADPTHKLIWTPSSALASGVYLYVIEAEEAVYTGTLVVVK